MNGVKGEISPYSLTASRSNFFAKTLCGSARLRLPICSAKSLAEHTLYECKVYCDIL
ncbi:hypothetical protein KSI01_31840 [Kurthia sibirica]|nr:hypothetical protein KSI01_31840 [Kurthia sibirica]